MTGKKKKVIPRFDFPTVDEPAVPELIRHTSIEDLAKSIGTSTMALNDFVPTVVDTPNNLVIKVQYSDMGERTIPKAVREPLSMLDMMHVDPKRPYAPIVSADPGVTLDNINATLIALGLWFHKSYPAEVDILFGWYGIEQKHPMPRVTRFTNGEWIYVPEVRTRPGVMDERFEKAKDGYFKQERDKNAQRNRTYPIRLLDIIRDKTQFKSNEMPRRKTATPIRSEMSLSSVILVLRARGIWVAHQYFHRYKQPLEISYGALMNAIEDKDISMLNINFDEMSKTNSFIYPAPKIIFQK